MKIECSRYCSRRCIGRAVIEAKCSRSVVLLSWNAQVLHVGFLQDDSTSPFCWFVSEIYLSNWFWCLFSCDVHLDRWVRYLDPYEIGGWVWCLVSYKIDIWNRNRFGCPLSLSEISVRDQIQWNVFLVSEMRSFSVIIFSELSFTLVDGLNLQSCWTTSCSVIYLQSHSVSFAAKLL